MKKWFPIILAVVFLGWAAGGIRPKKVPAGGMDFEQFGALPVVSNGRCQPMDSLARNSLLQLREKQTVNLEPWKGNLEKPRILSASEWMAAMMMKPQVADTWPVFRIDHPDIKGLLGLPMNADKAAQTDGKHFPWVLIQLRLQDLQREGQRAGMVNQQKRTPYEQGLVRLMNCVGLYMRLQNTLQPQNAKDWPAELQSYAATAAAGVAAYTAKNEKKPYDEGVLEKFMADINRFGAMGELEPPLLLTPKAGETGASNWKRSVEGLVGLARGEPMHFGLSAYARISGAYARGDAAGFNEAVADYRAALQQTVPGEVITSGREQTFNRVEPFYKALCMYVMAFVCVLLYWAAPARMEVARRTAWWLVVAALCIHTGGLLTRMLLEGRPPVTNLYSSAVFIGWGACILGLVLERFWRNSVGLAVSSTIGFLTLIIAHMLALSGDTMEMMRAVLDTNFWLATHVVVVTLGYASTYVAGFLAIIYIGRGVLTSGLDSATGKSLIKMVYGIVCFATLFSFVGTVLGGIWADQSWGRFWGWDPKENGALIIVLWNALILHARWGGLVRERGMANLAIVGNIVTSWSWFGVNMLGIGLHSYGFMESGFRWLMIFVGSQLLLLALGGLPQRLWRSARGLSEKPA